MLDDIAKLIKDAEELTWGRNTIGTHGSHYHSITNIIIGKYNLGGDVGQVRIYYAPIAYEWFIPFGEHVQVKGKFKPIE